MSLVFLSIYRLPRSDCQRLCNKHRGRSWKQPLVSQVFPTSCGWTKTEKKKPSPLQWRWHIQ
ncbi:unnamed protein product [Tuber aestivum]|uniref:Uncharacterized protein n=1 Tax=Tuber aestivum TaxID=59557 RepID=A0A292Q2T5_9PEZI|nr:unnamed protein product [Tuber aestivum]